jgi:hypothetical protein
LFDSGSLYLEVIIGGETLSPRQRLTSTAFSMKAGDAETVAGLTPSEIVATSHGHDGSDITTGTVADARIAASIARDSEITWGNLADIPSELADGDDVGITTETDPTVLPSVKDGVSWGEVSGKPVDFADGVDNTGITSVTAGSGLTGGGSSGGVTVHVGEGTGIDVSSSAVSVEVPLYLSGSADDVGTISGTNSHPGGYGVYGEATTNTSGNRNYGGYFSAAGAVGIGVLGEATETGEFKINYGGYFTAAGGEGIGVFGFATRHGSVPNVGGYFVAAGDHGKGVLGEGAGLYSYGVYGTSYNGYGVYGNSTNGHAGYFNGKTKVIGNLLVNSWVGIGTESPEYSLDVRGDRIQLKAFDGTDWIAMRTDGDVLDLQFEGGSLAIQSTTDGEHVCLNPSRDSNVGIGTWGPTQKLDVNGNARFRSVGSGDYDRPLNLTSDGTLTTTTSDRRLKANVENIEDGLEIVRRLQGVRFNWKEDLEGERRIGLIAQDVEEVLPELTFTNPVDGYMGIKYAELTAVLIEAVKAQQQIIDRLSTKLNELEKSKKTEITALKTQFTNLQALVETVIIQQTDSKDNRKRLSMKMWR